MKDTDRIPASESQSFSKWNMPEVNEGQIVQAEKTRRDVARGKAPEVDKELVVYSKLTVGEIEQISQRIQADVQKEAYQQGLKKGQNEGYQAGLQQGQQHIQEQLQSVQTLITHLNDALQAQDSAMEQGLVSVAVNVAQSVLRRELQLDSSHIQSVIHDAIASIAGDSKALDIYLNPEDIQLLQQQGDVESSWQLHEDSSLTRGGCRLANQFSLVEYTAEAQFQQTVDQLVSQRFAELGGEAPQVSSIAQPDSTDEHGE